MRSLQHIPHHPKGLERRPITQHLSNTPRLFPGIMPDNTTKAHNTGPVSDQHSYLVFRGTYFFIEHPQDKAGKNRYEQTKRLIEVSAPIGDLNRSNNLTGQWRICQIVSSYPCRLHYHHFRQSQPAQVPSSPCRTRRDPPRVRRCFYSERPHMEIW